MPALKNLFSKKHSHPISSHPSLFSVKSDYSFSICGSKIFVLSVKTSEILFTLKGHKDQVTSICLHPTNNLQLLSCSLDGTVRAWDIEDGTCLVTEEIDTPVLDMVVSSAVPGSCFVLAKRGETFGVEEICLEKTGKQSKTVVMKLVSRPNVRLATSGSFIAAAVENEIVVVDILSKRRIQYVNEEEISALCLSQGENGIVVAFGSVRGDIRLWHGLQQLEKGNVDNKGNVAVEILGHWHAHAVSSLAFSPDGSTVFSGGEEAVLVIWQVEQDDQTYLPRLGGHIKGITISHDGTLASLCLSDNSIKLVSTNNLATVWHLQGFSPNASTRRGAQAATFDPINGALVTPFKGGGALQWFDISTDRHMYSLDVAQRNQVSATNQKKPPKITMDAVSFSSEGQWLATVSRIDGLEVNTGDQSAGTLRFYSRSSQATTSAAWKLNSLLEHPHPGGRVTAAAFHPIRPILATIATNGTFRVWSNSNSVENSDGGNWQLTAEGSYRDRSVARTLAWSKDGSLLAIGFGATATLWGGNSFNTLYGVLTHPSPEVLQQVEFSPNSPHLIGATRRGIFVWDLLTLRVLWDRRMEVGIHGLTVHAKEARFGILTDSPLKEFTKEKKKKNGKKTKRRKTSTNGGSCVLVFDVNRQAPHEMYASEDDLVSLMYCKNNLLAIAQKGYLLTLSDTVDENSNSNETLPRFENETNAVMRNLSVAQGSQVDVAANSAMEGSADIQSSKIISSALVSMLDAPSHALPPTSVLFATLSRAVLAAAAQQAAEKRKNGAAIKKVEEVSKTSKKRKRTEQQTVEEVMDDDEVMEIIQKEQESKIFEKIAKAFHQEQSDAISEEKKKSGRKGKSVEAKAKNGKKKKSSDNKTKRQRRRK
eukprot:g1529.t1